MEKSKSFLTILVCFFCTLVTQNTGQENKVICNRIRIRNTLFCLRDIL